MGKVIYTLSIIIAGLVTGYIIKKLPGQGPAGLWKNKGAVRKTLQYISVLICNPLMILGAVWVTPLHAKIITLPLFELMALSLGGLLAWLLARALKSSPARTGSMVTCGIFTNVGSVGALIVFTFLGETAYSYVPFYKLFEEFVVFGIGFPLARYFGGQNQVKMKEIITGILKDPFFFLPVSVIPVGLFLNLTGVQRPLWYGPLNSVLIPAATFMLIVSIGMGMSFSGMKPHLKTGLMFPLIKSLIIPVVITSLAWAAGMGRVEDGLPLKVILILSAMPVGLMALVPPVLYNLDLDLSNAAWFLSTISLIIVIPVLSLLVM